MSVLVEANPTGVKSRRVPSNLSSLRARLFLPCQLRWIDDDAYFKIWSKSRRIGADYAEAFGVVESRLTGARAKNYNYSSYKQDTAREFVDYLRFFARGLNAAIEVFTDERIFEDSDLLCQRIVFPEINGVRAVARAFTSNPSAVRGFGGDGCLSEFAFHARPAEMWKAFQPASIRGGRLSLISTHNGEGSEFNRFVEMARRHRDGEARPGDIPFSLHETTIDSAIDEGIVELINETEGTTFTRESFREHCRAGCASEQDWLEEFFGVPNAQAGSFLPYEIMRPCVHARAPLPTAEWAQFLADISQRAGECSALYAGVDVGRKRDRFVVWVVGKVGGALRMLGCLVWQDKSYGEMQMICESLLRATFGNLRIRRMCLDATGIGAQLGEHCERNYKGRAEAIHFTASFKDELFPLLRRHIEERTTELPDDPVTLADHTSIRKTVTTAGKVRFAADDSEHGHADRAVAHALALHAADSGRCAFRPVQLPRGGGGWL